jgi:hypothetical protein
MKTLSSHQLGKLTIKQSQDGFTIWIEEETELGKIKHWLIDGSLLKQDSIIRLPNTTQYRFTAKYDNTDDSVKLIDTKIVKRKKIK